MTKFTLDQFGDRFMVLLPRLMREINIHESKHIKSGEVTPVQLSVLECLSRNGQCEMCRISEALNVSFSTATGMMDRLVKNGFVTREHGQKDRRTVIVTVTPKGRRVTKDIFNRKRQGVLKIFSGISADERARYLEILEKIVNNLSSAKGE
ncbi:MAG: hypothetical protein COW13_02350 [Candidatus Omnitrophica bacterium CG12_big_fil_rev_8_21_14_0_65_50_5]|nr:MAG: hypothetical protein COW13_02350 [Candidatus Omnitrophica bacterium CG12_big_fil_rev_8_21_14_0_65_50_5]